MLLATASILQGKSCEVLLGCSSSYSGRFMLGQSLPKPSGTPEKSPAYSGSWLGRCRDCISEAE